VRYLVNNISIFKFFRKRELEEVNEALEEIDPNLAFEKRDSK
jgi:hypothetical protein